nr:endonuclease/exonuclease/phosphatase family protein [Streptomyces xanthii]
MDETNTGATPMTRVESRTEPPPDPNPAVRRRGSRWTRGRVLAGLAAFTAALLLGHRLVPNTPGRLGSLLEAFLPWLGVVVPVLLGAALQRRSATALLALLLPVAAWAYQFGGLLLPGDAPTRAGLDVVQHNASDENTDPAATARALAAGRPRLIALEELLPSAVPAYEKALGRAYPYHAVRGTVGLWSRYPLTGVRAVDIRPRDLPDDWRRGLRAVVRTPHGEVAAYVAHLPSVRLGAGGFGSGRRDESARLLGDALEAERTRAVILLGDLNGTVDDRGLRPLTSRLNASGRGLAFSFPEAFPVARIDQIMARGGTVGRIRTLPATGSDHLPITARITLR